MSYTENRITQVLMLALAIVVSSGCKIVIEVPEGGSVTTESGNYFCAEAESCEVDVDDDAFAETFSAIPAEDYEFRGWKQRAGGLCQGELERLAPCSFSTVGYGLFPILLELLLDDIPVYLEPEFAPAGKAEIIFPSENSSATEAFITVRGTASDSDGIAAVTVNGVAASFSPAEGSRTTDTGLYTDVRWQLAVELQTGTNELVVALEDGRGEVNPGADMATVQNTQVPIAFALDEINNRVIGLVGVGFNQELVSYDEATRTQTLLAQEFFEAPPYCYQADTREFFYLSFLDTLVTLKSLNTETLVETTWGAITIDLEAEGFYSLWFARDLVCESGHDDVYLAYTFADAPQNTLNTFTNSRILKFDLDADEVRLLEEFDTNAGDASPLSGAKLMGDQLVVYPINPGPMFSIDTENGERSQLPVRENLFAWNIVPDAANQLLYVISIGAIYEVDLVTGSERILSFVQDDSAFTLPQPQVALLDADDFRILISDFDLQMILEVSLLSGTRSVFLSRQQGEGVGIVAGRHLALSSDQSKAYVLDDGGNVLERLLEVDLATGDRRQIGDLPQPFNELAAGLALDEEAGLAYAAFSNAISQVDLEAEQELQLAGSSVGFGPVPQEISDLVLDKANNRLLLADSELSAIVELDLQTRVRSVFSQAGARGAGDPFANVTALAFDAENNRLYAANQQTAEVVTINMETGDRSVLDGSCMDTSGQDQLLNSSPLVDLLYRDGKLLIRDVGLRRLDLDTAQCTELMDRIPINVSVFGMQWLNDEVLLTSGFDGVGLLDTVTGEFVRISE